MGGAYSRFKADLPLCRWWGLSLKVFLWFPPKGYRVGGLGSSAQGIEATNELLGLITWNAALLFGAKVVSESLASVQP